MQMHHIRGATRYGQLLWYTVLGPSNTQKIKSQKLVLGTHSCQQIGLFWDPWYFPCSMHTLGALCCCHRQTHRRPCSLYGQTWHRHSQSRQGVSLTSLHCHYFHVSYCKNMFLKKKMNEFLQPGRCGMDILGAMGSVSGDLFSNAGVGC